MHVAELDEVQYDLEIDGELVRKQLGRRVWERAGWATIAIAFAERDRDEAAWKPPKVALLRFRRVHGAWQRQAATTLHGEEALALADTIASWRDLVRAPA
jgi:hypothetical protein